MVFFCRKQQLCHSRGCIHDCFNYCLPLLSWFGYSSRFNGWDWTRCNKGILIRDASCLGQIDKLDIILFDKTGTITIGKPQVINLEHIPQITVNHTLQIFKTLELNSEHPLAQAILSYQSEIIASNTSTQFKSVIGKGVSAQLLMALLIMLGLQHGCKRNGTKQ